MNFLICTHLSIADVRARSRTSEFGTRAEIRLPDISASIRRIRTLRILRARHRIVHVLFINVLYILCFILYLGRSCTILNLPVIELPSGACCLQINLFSLSFFLGYFSSLFYVINYLFFIDINLYGSHSNRVKDVSFIQY